MAKQCPVCGQSTDDYAKFCAGCGTPLTAAADPDDAVTVVADDAFGTSPQPAPQPTYEPPVQLGGESEAPQPTYQPPVQLEPQEAKPTPQPAPQPTYQPPVQPANTYQPPVQPAQPAGRPYPTATPINASGAPNYAVPRQQQGYQNQYRPAPEGKSRNLGMGIAIAVIIGLLVIGGIVLAVVLINNASHNATSSAGTSANASSSLEGTYSLTAIHMDGETYQESGTMVVNSSNVGTFTDATGSSATFNFDPSTHTLTTSLGAAGTYTLSGNTLTITYTSDYSIVFTKQ